MWQPRPDAAAIVALVILSACQGAGRSAPSPSPTTPPRAAAGAPAPDPLDAWFKTDFPPADGFDFAFDTRRQGDVRAVAHGRVAFADDCGVPWGLVVMIDHVFYENHERRHIRSVYARLVGTRVRAGDIVKRREVIGSVAGGSGGPDTGGGRLELRWDATLSPTFTAALPAHDEAWIQERYADPGTFISARRRLAVPQDEPALLVVSSSQRKLRVWLRGERIGDFEVGFGQQVGRKRRQHDLRTPLGMYFVVEKGSPLGGGIGIHGWSGDWDLEGPRSLSWGCVVMRNEDMRLLFDRVPVGAMVVIL